MNYPTWEIPGTGGGLLIAIIAILHAFIAHFAVGGGLFLVLTEIRAARRGDQALMDYVQRHTWFFLLLTMVFGGITGVGIWFIIGLVNPAGTSVLIHHFVFGWAIEWVFFICEIVALLIYHYRFNKMSTRDHIRIGWLYFLFAWLSLFVINGILSFMLTPGRWLETGNFWHGFFNPGFLPSLIFRTGVAFFIAGIFGLITAVYTKDKSLQPSLFRYCLQWLYWPFLLVAFGGLFYFLSVPEASLENLFYRNPEAAVFIRVFAVSTLLLFVIGLIFMRRIRPAVQVPAAFLLALIGLAWFGGFEYMREIARKPYVINHYMYSNSILEADLDQIHREGYLKLSRWARIRSLTDEDRLEAGKILMTQQCLPCHTLNGYNGLREKLDKLTERGILAQLSGQGKIQTYMPPFAGTSDEMEALAEYLSREVMGQKPLEATPVQIKPEPVEIPPFNPATDNYVLLAWNDLGMHCISDNDRYFVFLPPANTLFAQLIKRGPVPEVVSEGVEISYQAESLYSHPENHVPFWDYAEKIFGVQLEPGTGLGGKAMEGTLDPASNQCFIAHLIPVVPYRDDQTFNPYPIFDVRAVDQHTGKILAQTKVVAPTSTEMGCRNCHQGGWRWNQIAGMDSTTAVNILAAHDRYNKTSLLPDALSGEPRLCQSCHEDPALGAAGQPSVLNLSSSIHGFHANYLAGLKDESCNLCHPSSVQGMTACLRGRHRTMGLNCTDCHGTLEDHALGLLLHEQARGKQSASRLMARLEPRMVADKASIDPRMPWLREPDCLSCHTDYNIKQYGQRPQAFNKWVAGGSALYRNRTDNHGVMCSACHGSTHAIYFATNPYGLERDNIQPIQYMNLSGTIGTTGNCKLCHTIEMPYNAHHRNMIRSDAFFRKPVLNNP